MSSRNAIDGPPPRLLIRADSSHRIGFGHAMRCLSLAQGAVDLGGSVCRVYQAGEGDLADRYRAEGIGQFPLAVPAAGLEDAAATIAVAKEQGAQWVVVDGYEFAADYVRVLREARLRVLRIDDDGLARDDEPDLLLNQNISASEAMYRPRRPGAELLLGTRYALLRREFVNWRGPDRRFGPTARRILVTLGGGPHRAVNRVLEALGDLDVPHLEVAVAGMTPEVVGEGQHARGASARFLGNVSDMTPWMAWADLAISGGGSTCWELAYMGLPNLIVVLAENQRGIADGLAARGISVNLGPSDDLSEAAIHEALHRLIPEPARRRTMSASGRQAVDGKGVDRVLNAMWETMCQ